MADDLVAEFTSITSAEPSRAQQYLQVADNDLAQAIQLYFDNDGADMAATLPAQSSSVTQRPGLDAAHPVTIDSDDEGDGGGVDLGGGGGRDTEEAESDEAMARRLQNEMYGAGSGGMGGEDIDPQTGVRRPVARTAETLAAPSGFRDEDDMNAMIAEQMAMRHERQRRNRAGHTRPGIFNQVHGEDTSAIWDEENGGSSSLDRQARLSRATGGASEASSKSSMLAEMYRPPTELISSIRTWEGVRAYGKEEHKWILVNIQDSNIFDCQVLNRDIWKDRQVQETVKEHFVFKQYSKHDAQAGQYIRYYFPNVDSDAAYPHIAIVDPRTGEQVKVWSGAPAPKAGEFLMQLHEFLDRYSLVAGARNPVATRRPERAREHDPDRMTEDEQMQYAMQQSLGNAADRRASGPRPEDPDALTRAQKSAAAAAASSSSAIPPSMSGANGSGSGSGSGSGTGAATPSTLEAEQGGHSAFFAAIPSTAHTEPAAGAPDTTRIQFRHPGGRVIRRFGLDDGVQTLYEWLKAEAPSPLGADRTGREFELVSMGRNLQAAVEKGETVGSAGLKMGTVMVEFV